MLDENCDGKFILIILIKYVFKRFILNNLFLSIQD